MMNENQLNMVEDISVEDMQQAQGPLQTLGPTPRTQTSMNYMPSKEQQFDQTRRTLDIHSKESREGDLFDIEKQYGSKKSSKKGGKTLDGGARTQRAPVISRASFLKKNRQSL